MRLRDTHMHLADAAFAADVEGAIHRMAERGVEGGTLICDPWGDGEELNRALALTEAHPQLQLAVGCHPLNALRLDPAGERRLSELLFGGKCAWVGEIGLDYSDGRRTRDAQLAALSRQLDMAYEACLPVQLHVRNAHGEMLEVLRDRRRRGCLPKCTVHGFSRGRELAAEYLGLGLDISVGVAVFFKKSERLAEALRTIPEDRLRMETDAPFGLPEPACIAEVYEKIQAIRKGCE